ncbi:MAG: aminodeoxychorismate lyase [Thermomonas sp.]|uniref:aminodeoxychorismate lyase n=1 Tax=Thermomonas sp. TaxID=1971895 RepID=UPI002605052F|nr:aminodeoxychorismate lyase [Thermomonas sp.]MCC7096472.1 aminodeoxychorismate lyase [Thermomonas sp.]
MTPEVFMGRDRLGAVSSTNRGLNYGDGLFETMRVDHGSIPLWPRHLARLQVGAERLALPLPDVAFLTARIQEHSAGLDAGVIKLLVTRGDGGRGYAPPVDVDPVWALSLHPLPQAGSTGLRLHVCETRLALQPALAGIKHCNRLEQVLARLEVQRADCDEGLMRNMESHPVCATSANLLVHRDGRWWTPPVETCGVAGVLRGWLLGQGLVDVAALSMEDLTSADALALCNAVRGILPVSMLGGRTWAASPAIHDLQVQLAMAYPMFSVATVVA